MAQAGDVNPMIPGLKQCAIFGFCDIRNFTDATEVLQAEVMVFVNKIAEVVHKTVDKYFGAANKNIGDAFLLVWKLPEQDINVKEISGNLKILRTKNTKNFGDLSVICFLKILIRINKKEEILEYRKNKKLLDRIPNYKVKMGFGLHVGWAIEGAIGSVYKIDASYLSPNVNMASRLEAATKQYGVPILISGKLFKILSKRMQKYLRYIDRVTVKGSVKPIKLFTPDVFNLELFENISSPQPRRTLNKEEKNDERHFENKFNFSLALRQGCKASKLIENDIDLMLLLRSDSNQEFREKFDKGFEMYISGDWKSSKKFFLEALEIREDNPIDTLMNFMEKNNFVAEENWNGFRALTEK